MAAKFLKDNLPWIVPSVAIVLAAAGFFDRGGNSSVDVAASDTVFATAAPAPSVRQPAPTASQPAAPLTVAQAPAPAPVESDLVARQATAPVGGLQTPSSLQTEPAAVAVVAPAPAPTPAVVEPEPESRQEVAYSSTDNAAAFFNAAQASLAAQNSCKEDLRTLTNQATVYFPSGGLTPDVSGIEQARLIGLVAQNCPGIRIQVEGHSDPSGNPNTNLRLSRQRAESIIQRIGASGIDTSNFAAQGFGDRRPSGTIGPNSRAYYDRRVEFTLIETVASTVSASFATTSASTWQQAACVGQLETAVASTKLFYSLRSVAVRQNDLDRVIQLATQASACPQARLRVIGMHADESGSGETPATGRLRAKALMTMLVGRGISPEQIIIAAPSRNIDVPGQPGLSGSRVDFDVILEEG